MKQSLCILALAFVSLQSAKSFSQVTILSSGWGATGACYSLARYHGEYFIEGHQGHLNEINNIEALDWALGDSLRLVITEMRPDGPVILERSYVIEWSFERSADDPNNWGFFAVTDRPIETLAIRIGKTYTWEDYGEWTLELED